MEDKTQTTIDLSLRIPDGIDCVQIDDEFMQASKVEKPGYTKIVMVDPYQNKGAIMYVKCAVPQALRKPKSKARR